jgi:hypothetical protein
VTAPGRAAAYTLLVVLAGAVAAAGLQGQGVPPGIDIVARAVSPSTIEVGAEALERLVVTAPEGVTVSVQDAGPPVQGNVERLGAWRSSRSSAGSGDVVWTFTAPLTAWTAGAHETPPLTVAVRRNGRVGAVGQESLAFRAVSPLPSQARVLRPSPPLPPERVPPAWPGLLAVLPVLAAAGSGWAWWRGRAVAAGVTPAGAPAAPVPSVRESLAGVDVDPAVAAVRLAEAVRGHALLTAMDVRGSHTTGEVVRLLAGSGWGEGVEGVLDLADRVKYAGSSPTAREVVEAAARLDEAFAHG